MNLGSGRPGSRPSWDSHTHSAKILVLTLVCQAPEREVWKVLTLRGSSSIGLGLDLRATQVIWESQTAASLSPLFLSLFLPNQIMLSEETTLESSREPK